jgi:hypothetical protein
MKVIWLQIHVKLLSICLDTQVGMTPILITVCSYALHVESLTERSGANGRVRLGIKFLEYNFQR